MGFPRLRSLSNESKAPNRGEAWVKHIEESIQGQTTNTELCLAGILSGGHILLEGPPGAGKTTLAKSFSECFEAPFRRIQMTSDLLPSEITGALRLDPKSRSDLVFRPGPIFSNFVLADEINRANPKTQSALLEAMAESHVSIDGTTHSLPRPFHLIATQNPTESIGVFPLTESQLDRFCVALAISYPDPTIELEILKRPETKSMAPKAHANLDELVKAQKEVSKVSIEESLSRFILAVGVATRNDPRIENAASTRALLQWSQVCKALAWLRGRNFVIPEDITDSAAPVLAHRLSLRSGDSNYFNKIKIVHDILNSKGSPT